MGSPKVSSAKPQTMDSKIFKTSFSLRKFFFQKDKKKEKVREKELTDKKNEPNPTKTDNTAKEPETAVACILEPFKKLEINTIKKQIAIENDQDIVRDIKEASDEFDNFTFKVIEDDETSPRIESQSSHDSGYSEINQEVVETLKKLNLHDKTESVRDAIHDKESKDEIDKETKDKREIKDDTETKEDKKKRMHQVIVKRTPIRAKVSDYSIHPYAKDAENAHRPISQINKQTLSGGQVIVNPTPTDFSELNLARDALKSVAELYHSDPTYWEDVLDVITNDNQADDVLSEFPQINEIQEYSIQVVPKQDPTPNPIEEFSTHLSSYDESDIANSLLLFGNSPNNDNLGIFPTPPRSVPSPLSESHAFYASNSEYTLSPARSSPNYNSDFEKYQEISPISYDEVEKVINRDRTSSISQSSMTMKNFKDLQKEISNGFSKKECCDIDRKSCKDIFEERMIKLKMVERKNLCLNVSKLDLKTAYGVLHHILLSLSKECEQEDLQYALFALVCQRVLAQTPALFAGDFGLSILKAAALRCPDRPLLTRYIVHCVYLVLRSDPKLCTNECVFHEVDAQGDNLVIACARGGDAYALVLAEITRNDLRGELPPLFRLHHANSDGYSALHMACRMHSAANPRLHTVHVLLEHAHADIWKGDIKGGDTALHLAVNSSTCSLELVMMLFKHQDRKLWKKLAHAQNMSSVTPLEYARSATKSTTRQNYPQEVLDFLKKCR